MTPPTFRAPPQRRIYRDGVALRITPADFIKTLASLRAVISALHVRQDLPEAQLQQAFRDIGRRLAAETGAQWSFLTAMQYLSGQRAAEAAHHWAASFHAAGLTQAQIDALIAFAAHYCANGVEGKTLSAGTKVGKAKGQPMPPQDVLELIALSPQVLDQALAHWQAAGAHG